MKSILAVALVATLALTPLLASCNTLSALSGVAASLKGPIPGQATTLSEAVQIADLATNLTKSAVDTFKFPKATLQELSALNDGLHSAVVSLERANANHQALDFASFNAALSAYNSYAAANGIGAIH